MWGGGGHSAPKRCKGRDLTPARVGDMIRVSRHASDTSPFQQPPHSPAWTQEYPQPAHICRAVQPLQKLGSNGKSKGASRLRTHSKQRSPWFGGRESPPPLVCPAKQQARALPGATCYGCKRQTPKCERPHKESRVFLLVYAAKHRVPHRALLLGSFRQSCWASCDFKGTSFLPIYHCGRLVCASCCVGGELRSCQRTNFFREKGKNNTMSEMGLRSRNLRKDRVSHIPQRRKNLNRWPKTENLLGFVWFSFFSLVCVCTLFVICSRKS